jgi:cytochrome c
MYMLEYGSVYGIDNEDARLVRIDYNGGNRAPVAKASANDTVGTGAPNGKVQQQRQLRF